MNVRILHLSDTHLTGEPGPNRTGVDPRESLRRILHDCRQIPGLDAVVLTGDIADDGTPEAYTDARAIVAEFTGHLGIPALFTTGNHDERAAFTKILGTGHLGPDGHPLPADHLDSPTGERAATTTIAGHRIVTLDSLIPGKGSGQISTTQLDWLAGVLATPAPKGTILAFHHPPIAVPGVAVQHHLGLRDPAALATVITGTDVRLILCGHFHLQIFGLLGGVPTWVTPGVVNRIDLTATPGTERAVRGASATLADLSVPTAPILHTLHARDPHQGETAYEADTATLSRIIADLA
ncbi:phosphohydrolase [Actinoplanes capillaceus]|uniref:Phosphohydrolase n=1 Tax=Actinoplanes campanulatus TaxID=113559 RepID=A0ABQ3WNN0_9ACTN|nr:phosphohydrolase [Actinoplanes capillaceus]